MRIVPVVQAMGRTTNRDAGLTKAASAYALFCRDLSRHGVCKDYLKRLHGKTAVNGKAQAAHKWSPGCMFSELTQLAGN